MRRAPLLLAASLLVPATAWAAPEPDKFGSAAPLPSEEAAPPVLPQTPPGGELGDHFYFGFSAGLGSADLPAFDYATAGNDAIRVDSDYGFDGSVFVGYDLGAFRLEAEVAYRRAGVDTIETGVGIPVDPLAGSPFLAPPGDYDSGGGSSSALSFMINGMLDFGDEDGLSGFLGGGVGVARIDYSNIRLFDDAHPTLDASDEKFAWQIFAGIRHPIGNNLDATASISHFQTGKLKLESTGGVPIDAGYRSNSVKLGLIYNLGPGGPGAGLSLSPGKGFYAGTSGGISYVPNIDFDIGGSGKAAHADFDFGWDVDATIGYDFGGFRAEAEIGYRQANITAYASGLPTPFLNNHGVVGGDVPPGSYDYAGGTSSALSFMLNGMLDFGDDDGIQGFVGAGLGVSRIKSELALNTDGDFLDDSDTAFAWQVIAGLRAPLNDTIDVTFKYRFFNADNIQMVDVVGREYEGRFRSHSLLGGLTFNFGAPEPR